MKVYKFKRKIIRWTILVVGLIFILPALWNVICNTVKIYFLNIKKRELRIENEKLKQYIAESSTEEYIERIARTKLGLKKSNEIEYRFLSEK
ncbi:MAG: septum formation initiator family protein [Elusimicrobiales bacterium]|nr:septum formation initiator family protein [Elusimicrobiales bacterium]